MEGNRLIQRLREISIRKLCVIFHIHSSLSHSRKKKIMRSVKNLTFNNKFVPNKIFKICIFVQTLVYTSDAYLSTSFNPWI